MDNKSTGNDWQSQSLDRKMLAWVRKQMSEIALCTYFEICIQKSIYLQQLIKYPAKSFVFQRLSLSMAICDLKLVVLESLMNDDDDAMLAVSKFFNAIGKQISSEN